MGELHTFPGDHERFKAFSRVGPMTPTMLAGYLKAMSKKAENGTLLGVYESERRRLFEHWEIGREKPVKAKGTSHNSRAYRERKIIDPNVIRLHRQRTFEFDSVEHAYWPARYGLKFFNLLDEYGPLTPPTRTASDTLNHALIVSKVIIAFDTHAKAHNMRVRFVERRPNAVYDMAPNTGLIKTFRNKSIEPDAFIVLDDLNDGTHRGLFIEADNTPPNDYQDGLSGFERSNTKYWAYREAEQVGKGTFQKKWASRIADPSEDFFVLRIATDPDWVPSFLNLFRQRDYYNPRTRKTEFRGVDLPYRTFMLSDLPSVLKDPYGMIWRTPKDAKLYSLKD